VPPAQLELYSVSENLGRITVIDARHSRSMADDPLDIKEEASCFIRWVVKSSHGTADQLLVQVCVVATMTILIVHSLQPVGSGRKSKSVVFASLGVVRNHT
jgi:hypothetical protein